jgi:PEP-CTERM motif
VATNKGAGTEGFFKVFGTGLGLSDPFAGSFYDPTYVITGPGVFFTLTGTLLDGQEIRATCFEEGLQLGEAARSITFTSAVPEPGVWAMMLAGLGMLTGVRRRA